MNSTLALFFIIKFKKLDERDNNIPYFQSALLMSNYKKSERFSKRYNQGMRATLTM